VLLRGVNDRPRHAVALAGIARDLRANVNLLRWNPVPGLPFERPASEEAAAFQKLLRDRGVNAHVRRSRGSDAAAACGQLRRVAASDEARTDEGT
jgi:23S rRNA (adenine2503-C2)-methyltransferase